MVEAVSQVGAPIDWRCLISSAIVPVAELSSTIRVSVHRLMDGTSSEGKSTDPVAAKKYFALTRHVLSFLFLMRLPPVASHVN